MRSGWKHWLCLWMCMGLLMTGCGASSAGAVSNPGTETSLAPEAQQGPGTGSSLTSETQQDPGAKTSGTGEKQSETETDKSGTGEKAETEEKTEIKEKAETEETSEKEETMAATLLYQGHASIRIVTGDNKVIYVDPFMGEGYDLPADLILMTHGHYDHTQDNMIEKKNEGCTLIKWTDALKDGVYQTSDLGYVKVEPVEAGYNKNHDSSECVGFVLTFPDGIKVYLSGDTSTTPSMPDLAKKEIDYAFLCCDGVYNMDVKEASECAKVIGAKHTIPYHMEPVKDKTGFDQAAADAFEAPGKLILRPGEELELK